MRSIVVDQLRNRSSSWFCNRTKGKTTAVKAKCLWNLLTKESLLNLL